tara:strand:+ start:1204 stop:1773 length:570 start_codon:yes stop_codon:yes gene_type:complete
MKTFAQFQSDLMEVYDPEVQGRSQIKKSGEGGRIGADRRKTEPEKRRMKAVGGGKMVPAKSYKDRKDIGQQRQRSEREQQPTQDRGSAREKQLAAAKAERKRAAQARAAAKKSGGSASTTKTTSKDTEKQATKLLTKKSAKKPVSPNYKPQPASGKSREERRQIRRQGEKLRRHLVKGINKPAKEYEPR